MSKTIEVPVEFISWLEARIEYYNHEYRYAKDEKSKEIATAKKNALTEVLGKMKYYSRM